jgi:hypothetical protein
MNQKLQALIEAIVAARHEAAILMLFDRTVNHATKQDATAIFRLLSGAAALAGNAGASRGIVSDDWCRALLTSTPEEAIKLFWERRGFKCNGGRILPAVSAAEIEKNLLTAWREFSSIDADRTSGVCVPIEPGAATRYRSPGMN